MAARKAQSDVDLDRLGERVAQGFDEVDWKAYNSRSIAKRMDTQLLVQTIEGDLMKIAKVDTARAARIWDDHVPSFVPRPTDLPEKEPEPSVANSIEPGRPRRRQGAEPFLDPSMSLNGSPDPVDRARSSSKPEIGASTRTAPKEQVAEDPNAERIRLLLDGLNRQYLKADDKYHFRDKGGDVAFEAQEKRLVTQHEAPTVVTSMIDLAEARGWSSLRLTGTKEFRREAWLQASLRDIDVSGYQPTKLDKTRFEEMKAERGPSAPENTIRQDMPRAKGVSGQDIRFEPVAEDGRVEPKLPLTTAQDQFLRTMEATMRHRGDSAEAIERARVLANEKLTADRIHVGALVEVGHAPYQDRRGEKVTPFVTLRDDQGQVTRVWGVDLPRALEASGAEPGQKLAVVFRGRRPVEVDAPVRDSKGETVRTERKTVDRNTWEIVPFDRLRDEAKASAAKAVDRQNNPAGLKVFDPAAQPSRQPRVDRGTGQRRDRTKERAV